MSSTEVLIFGNRWEVKGTIGKGAFSEIFAAEDMTGENGKELVAIKFHNAEFDSSVMKWEGIVLADLSDIPYVPHLIYYGNEYERDYLVMELLSGEDMAQLRDRTRHNVDSKMIPIEIVSYLTRQMMQCLEPMHKKGYVHRDVKPSNFVRRSAESTEFCIIDFGLAKQHRDAQGKLRPEREHVEFRGTTIYASPYVHSGHDQCPRDDMFSVLHVFLDLVLGDLPWRAQAKARDKAGVAALKAKLVKDPAAFLEDYIHWQEDIVQADSQHVADLRVAVAAISDIVCDFVAHLKSLSYGEYPTYDYLSDLLLHASPEGVSDAQISALSYHGHGFDWNDGRCMQEVMARFRHQASSHAQAHSSGANGGGGASKSRRSSFDRDTKDRLPTDHQDGMNGKSGANSSSKRHSSSHTTTATTASSSGAGAANKPFMKVHVRGQGTAGEYKLQTLHDKLATLQTETDNFRATQAAAQLSAMGGSMAGTPSKANPTSSSASKITLNSTSNVTLPKLGLEVAVRWRNLTRELLKLPEAMLTTSSAFDTLTLCLQVLQNNAHFYSVNLGELDVNWADFADVQTTVAALYEYYATIKHNRSKALDDLLADIGDSSPLDAAEEGNATPHASSAGTAVVTPQQAHTSHHASDDAQDGVQDGGVEALLSGVSGADVVLQESAPSNVEAEEADANSSEASNASAPVSAAPSSADLAQLVSQNEETDNELLLHQQQERRASEEEDGERDSPAKRARLE